MRSPEEAIGVYLGAQLAEAQTLARNYYVHGRTTEYRLATMAAVTLGVALGGVVAGEWRAYE